MNFKSNKQTAEVVIVSMPWVDTTAPLMAPALLKSIVLKTNKSCTAIDLNAEVFNLVKTQALSDEIITFFFDGTIPSDRVLVEIKKIFEFMAHRIMDYEPKYVCLSLLTYISQVSTKWLCFLIKKQFPDVKIIIGGPGIYDQLMTENDSYVKMLKENHLIDHYVRGDGENALYELLTGNENYEGIDSDNWKEIDDLTQLPFPDYDDYNWDLYEWPYLSILGSRGCVRRCTFCDIHEHWKRFIYRSGEHIFQEMLYQNKKYGIKYFKFNDSLINGNQKEYTILTKLLAEHNNTNPNNKFSWSSYFIFRPESQMKEDVWRLTAESGADQLYVGVESLVDKNRFHLKKKFTNDDIEYSLRMAKKYKLNLLFLMIVGYVTETETDHQDTLKWVAEHEEFNDIVSFNLGGTLGILPNTYLDKNQIDLGIQWTDDDILSSTGVNIKWFIPQTNNTYEVRVRRLQELEDIVKKHNFSYHRPLDPHKELENLIKLKLKNDANKNQI
jgi:radical SAM superfamily enzyme YgiQ (UPF0313 family)